MKKDQFTLYVDSKFISPYAMTAFLSMTEKNLDFELKTIKLGTAELKHSLTSRVPTLVHNDFSLSESSAISEYIEDLFSGAEFTALYPKNAEDRARARQIQAWIRSDLMPIREERPTSVIFISPSDKPLSAAAVEASEKLIEVATQLIGNKTSLFNEWCIADADLALILNRLIKNNDPVPQNLINYVDAQWKRPSIQAWLKLTSP